MEEDEVVFEFQGWKEDYPDHMTSSQNSQLSTIDIYMLNWRNQLALLHY
jgi:hypothetical protein